MAGRANPTMQPRMRPDFVVHVELFLVRTPELWTLRMAEQGPLSVGQPRYGTYGPKGGLDNGAGDPGGPWRYNHVVYTYTYEGVFISLGRRGRCADIQRLPGYPARLTLNGRARPLPGPTRLSRSATVHMRRLKDVVLGHVHCRATVVAIHRQSLF